MTGLDCQHCTVSDFLHLLDMGSEQSTSSGGAGKTSSSASADPLYSLSRQDIIGAGVTSPTTERQESICSDVEVPYVSYTVNKPIGGDSPKKKKATLSSASTGSGAGGAIKKRSFLGEEKQSYDVTR